MLIALAATVSLLQGDVIVNGILFIYFFPFCLVNSNAGERAHAQELKMVPKGQHGIKTASRTSKGGKSHSLKVAIFQCVLVTDKLCKLVQCRQPMWEARAGMLARGVRD